MTWRPIAELTVEEFRANPIQIWGKLYSGWELAYPGGGNYRYVTCEKAFVRPQEEVRDQEIADYIEWLSKEFCYWRPADPPPIKLHKG